MAAYQRQSQGFSLVELMISLAIGLIVVSAVLAFTLSSLTANSEYVQSTRLSQELRNTMDFVSRELRRAGFCFCLLKRSLERERDGVKVNGTDELDCRLLIDRWFGLRGSCGK